VRPRPYCRRASLSAARRAFTLVELVTAASLMTVIMVGVVEIFSIVTQTAGDAEGMVFAQSQARAFFDRLHNELRGMTREGYLRIVHNSINAIPDASGRYVLAGPQPTTGDPKVINNGDKPNADLADRYYAADSIGFVSVGQFSSTFTQTNLNPSLAEVLYSNNVISSKTVLSVSTTAAGGSAYGNGVAVNPRRGILARGQWLFGVGQAASANDLVDNGAAKFLSDMLATQPAPAKFSPSPTVAAAVWPTTALDRVSIAKTNPGMSAGYLMVTPWISQLGMDDRPPTLRRVLASCCSEFYVEAYDPGGSQDLPVPLNFPSGANPLLWGSAAGRGTTAFTSLPMMVNGAAVNDVAFYWSTNQWPIAKTNTYPAGSATTFSNLRTWPKAIRVTIALHDPSETRPLSATSTDKRFRGMAMQEIFWITDP
jgi:hypothetical protein